MSSQNQNPKELLAQGNLESALETLVRLCQHADDADLRQRVLTLSGQFAALKKQHLTGLLEDKDYRLQLNRITAAVAEIVDSNSKSLVQAESPIKNKKADFWKKLGYVGLIVGILAGVVKIVEYLQKPHFAPVETPAVELPKKDTIVVTTPAEKPKPEVLKKDKPAQTQKAVDVKVKGDVNNSNIIIGDGNQVKQ